MGFTLPKVEEGVESRHKKGKKKTPLLGAGSEVSPAWWGPRGTGRTGCVTAGREASPDPSRQGPASIKEGVGWERMMASQVKTSPPFCTIKPTQFPYPHPLFMKVKAKGGF